MLSVKECEEIRKILDLIETPDIFTLADTVTNKLIAVTSRNEAVDGILQYSTSTRELLKRRKIKRETLFKYLHSVNIYMPPSAEKGIIIEKILEHWGSAGELTENLALQDREEDDVEDVEEANDESQLLAEHFIPWFYKVLHSNSPSLQCETVGKFGPHHFWDDCKLQIRFLGTKMVHECIDGSNLVAERLQEIVTAERLILNPNVTTGSVSGKMNRHGLVMVLSCGTVHRGSDVLGVFEQTFGLVRDPLMENNWRVKFTNLTMQSGAAPSVFNLQTVHEALSITSQ